jgi:hypothetical protein
MFLAYKYVLLSVMVLESAFLAERLQLATDGPITTNSVVKVHIDRPPGITLMGAADRIDTAHYAFSYSSDNRCIL